MAGHSKSKTIAHRKGAQDKKRGQIFTKLTRALAAVARANPDPEFNAQLRSILIRAKAAGLPKERIASSLNLNANNDNEDSVMYEAYAPGGIGLIIECLTDNKNRIVGEIRPLLSKYSAKLQPVMYLFENLGYVRTTLEKKKDVLEVLKELQPRCTEDSEGITILVDKEYLPQAQQLVRDLDIEVGLCWSPYTKLESRPEFVGKLLESLEENNDVQQVWVNC